MSGFHPSGSWLGRALAAALLLLGSTACSSGAVPSATDRTGHGADSGATSRAANPTAVAHLDPGAFAEALAQPGARALDVRTAEEFSGGHIAGAMNIDVEDSAFAQRVAGLDKSSVYAVYCRSGRRSAAATSQMVAAGFESVVDLAGGVAAWLAAGNPLTLD